jgi:cell division protein FtsL
MKTGSIRSFKESLEMSSQPLKRLQKHRYFAIALISLALVSAACVHVWQRVVVLGLVKEVGQLQKESRELVDGIEKVQSDIAALTMAGRIEQYARDSLGLGRVTPTHLYTLAPEAIKDVSKDELATMLSSIKRVANYLPVLSEAQADITELQPIRFEDDGAEGAGQR